MTLKCWMGVLGSGGWVAAIWIAGCGQDVATCDTVCAFPDAPQDTCSQNCSNAQGVAEASGYGGDYQALLTCQSNANSYDSIEGVCASFAAQLSADADGGSTADPCAAASCTSVCASEAESSICASQCEAARSECPSSADPLFQSFLTCLCNAGGLSGSAAQAQCSGQAATLEETCPAAFGSGVGAVGAAVRK